MDEMKNNIPENEETVQPEKVEPVADAEAPADNPSAPSQPTPAPVQPPVAPPFSLPPQPPVQQGNGYGYNSYGYNAPYIPPQPPVQPDRNYASYNNYADRNWNGTPHAQYQQPTDTDGKEMRKTNGKGRKAFLIVLAVVVAVSAIAIPVSLSGKFKFSDIFNSEDTVTEAPTINENAPIFDITDTPVSDGTGTGEGVLTPEQVYEKIAASNVAVMVYKDNELYTEGTGIIMKEDDAGEYTYILTCAHVISDPGVSLVIQMEDGARHDAQMVGYDLRTDIGVVRIKGKGFKVAEFGNSDSLKVGSTVYAIGNPGGSALFGTFTDGKVSAIGRSITSSIGYDMVCIQHNAAISPGNSGGALVNEYGQVIGINSSKIAATEFEGISFSIPITQAKDIINDVMTYGYVPGRPKLGISYVANDSSSISSIYGMAVQMMKLPSGSLVIYSIDEDSGLANTKVEPGDMITAVNGKNLDTADVLLETIENSAVGDELELSIFRIQTVGGRYSTEEFKVKVKLIEEKNVNRTEETTTRGVFGNDH